MQFLEAEVRRILTSRNFFSVILRNITVPAVILRNIRPDQVDYLFNIVFGFKIWGGSINTNKHFNMTNQNIGTLTSHDFLIFN